MIQDDSILEINPQDRPAFGFGNSSRDQCVSTKQMRILAGNKVGALKIHALDKGNGPVLLRSLKAIIDFDQDAILFRGLDPSRIVPLDPSRTSALGSHFELLFHGLQEQ